MRHKFWIMVIILLLPSICYAGTCRIRGISENIKTYGVGKDYTVLATWEAYADTNLIGYWSQVLECYNNGSSFDDYVVISGANTDPNYFRIVRPASGQGHNGTASQGVIFSSTMDTSVFYIAEKYFSLQDVSLSLNQNSANSKYVVQQYENNVSVIGCILFNSTNAGAGSNSGIYLRPGEGNYSYTINCLLYGIEYNGIVYSNGIGIVYNCTVDTCLNRGIYCSASLIAKNVVASNNGTDWYSTCSKYNCTDEGATPSYVGAGDYHLQSGDSICKDIGTNLSVDPNGYFSFNDDINNGTMGAAKAGETRPYNSVWDIGFDEYIPGEAPVSAYQKPQIFIYD